MNDLEQVEDKFESELRDLINKHSKESRSHTPDFVLADYLCKCLDAFDYAIGYRQSVERSHE